MYINYRSYKHRGIAWGLPGSYPGQEAQVQAAGDLQQLQGLGGRAKRKGDLEAVVRVKHQLGGAVTILEHRLQQGAHGNQSGWCFLTVENGKLHSSPEPFVQTTKTPSSRNRRWACKSSRSSRSAGNKCFAAFKQMLLYPEKPAVHLGRTWTGLSSVHSPTISLASPSVDLLTCSSQAAWDSGLRVVMALELWRFLSFSHSSR